MLKAQQKYRYLVAIHHQLSMAVLERSTRVTVSILLTVNNTTLYCLLYLIDCKKKKKV